MVDSIHRTHKRGRNRHIKLVEMAASLLTGMEFERPDNGMEIARLMPNLNRGVK